MDFDNEVSDDEILWEEVYDQVTQELNFAFRPIDSIPSCVFCLNKSQIFLFKKTDQFVQEYSSQCKSMNLTETMIKDFSRIVNFVNLETLVLDKNELEV